MLKKPKQFKCFGIFCWHDYQSNPKKVELSVSPNDKNWIYWGTLQFELIEGAQFLDIDPLPTCYNYLKVSVLETFGQQRVYVNQFYLLADRPKTVAEQTQDTLPKEQAGRSTNGSQAAEGSRMYELQTEVEDLRNLVGLLTSRIEVLEETVQTKDSRVRHLTELVDTMAAEFRELVQQECAQMRQTVLREVWAELGLQQKTIMSRPESRAGMTEHPRDFTLGENPLLSTNGKNSDSSLRMQQRALVDLVKQFKNTLHLRVALGLTDRILRWSS